MIEKKEWERNFMREKEKRRENVFALNRKEKKYLIKAQSFRSEEGFLGK